MSVLSYQFWVMSFGPVLLTTQNSQLTT